MATAKNWSALIWWKFEKCKDFTRVFDSATLYSFWISFGKCKLRLRVKIWVFSVQTSFDSNAISSFHKDCKTLGKVGKNFASECIWMSVLFAFLRFCEFCFQVPILLHLKKLFHFIFEENLRLLVCKVLWQKSNLFRKFILLC